MKLRIWLLGVAAALVSLAGCQKRASFDPALAGAFFPLRPGLSWTYRFTGKDPNTNATITNRSMVNERLASLRAADRAMGHAYITSLKAAGEVVSEYSGAGGTGTSRDIYVLDGGYITRVSTLDNPAWIVSGERQFLPRLLRPGLTWSNSLLPFGSPSTAFRVVQEHRTFLDPDEVVVPAGRFSGCIRIETDAVYGRNSREHDQFRYLDWYAPNVGLVRTLFLIKGGFFGSETEIARLELLKFGESPVTVASRSNEEGSSTPSARLTEGEAKE
jgi:hypothetical protein